MKYLKKISLGACALGFAFVAGVAAPALSQTKTAEPQENAQQVRTGMLKCEVEGGVGFIIGSKKKMRCVFTPNEVGQYPQYYSGEVAKWGLDVGATKDAVIIWAVMGSTRIVPNGNLAGEFGGVSAEATLALGIGANLLVGGTGNGYVLQPLSVQGQTGLNLAVGVTKLRLWLGQ